MKRFEAEAIKRGWRLSELARQSGIDPSNLRKIASGDLPLWPGWKKKLSGVLNIETDYLLEDVGLEIVSRQKERGDALMMELAKFECRPDPQRISGAKEDLLVSEPSMDKPFLLFNIRHDSGEVVGWVEVHSFDKENKKAESGIALLSLDDVVLGNLKAELDNLWFNTLDLNRITMRVPEHNVGVNYLLNTLNYRLEGVEVQGCSNNGQLGNILTYGRCKSEATDIYGSDDDAQSGQSMCISVTK